MFEQMVVLAAIGIIILAVTLFILIKSKKMAAEREDLLNRIVNDDQFEFYLFDLRSYEEYTEAHIPGAISYPIEEIEEYLPTEKMFLPLFVYGSSQRQSAFGASRLSEKGYFNVQSLGTLKVWKGKMECEKLLKAIDLLRTPLKESK